MGLSFQPGSGDTGSVRFPAAIPRAGKYSAYIYFPKVKDISSQTLVIVHDGERDYGIVVKESDIRVEGQTSGEWVALGDYNLPAGNTAFVQVATKDADGKVIADAVVWVPAE